MDHDNHDSKMMWLMMICCLAPILFIFLFGSGAKALGAPSWIVIGVVVVFAIVHFLTMKKSHRHTDDTAKEIDSDKKSGSDTDDTSCH